MSCTKTVCQTLIPPLPILVGVTDLSNSCWNVPPFPLPSLSLSLPSIGGYSRGLWMEVGPWWCFPTPKSHDAAVRVRGKWISNPLYDLYRPHLCLPWLSLPSQQGSLHDGCPGKLALLHVLHTYMYVLGRNCIGGINWKVVADIPHDRLKTCK